MVQALSKSKVVFHEANLSALAISNFVKAIGSDIPVIKAPKPNVDRPEFFYIELKIDATTSINGELSIMDYIATQKNRVTQASNMHLF